MDADDPADDLVDDPADDLVEQPGEHHDGRVADGIDKARKRLDKLEQGRRTGLYVAATKRFFEVEGLDQSGLLAIELFTTIIPLIVIGFAYFCGFAENASVGDLVIRQMNVSGALADTVRATFERSSNLRSAWSITGVAGFLIWGIPMALTVSRLFARAWKREEFPNAQRIVRGTIWFFLYLATIIAATRISYAASGNIARVELFFVSGLPYFVLWSLTPIVLVRDGGNSWRYLTSVGLVGLLVDSFALRIVARIIFPILRSGWTGFGPIGVALALMTWCGVIGTGWVLTSCIGAVLWERRAPIETVLDAQVA